MDNDNILPDSSYKDLRKYPCILESIAKIPKQLKNVKLINFNYAEISKYNIITLTFDDFIIAGEAKFRFTGVPFTFFFNVTFLEHAEEEFTITFEDIPKPLLSEAQHNSLHLFFEDNIPQEEFKNMW